jgi:Family of unknown function (DUF6496)
MATSTKSPRAKKAASGKSVRKYSLSAQEKVAEAMHEMKNGELRSGTSGKAVKNSKQAVAIGLSKARRAGAKVPRKKQG